MAENQFLGVYATLETPSFVGASEVEDDDLRPLMKRKRLWFVWALASERYQVQPLNALFQPMAAPSVISALDFEKRFSFETGCSATPQDGDAKGQTAQIAPQKLIIRADDPDLLRTWLLRDVPPPPPDSEPLILQAEQVERPSGESRGAASEKASSPRRSSEGSGGSAPIAAADAEQSLRAGFAMALLKLKQGSREQGIEALNHVLAWNGPPFEGVAEVFSEFGLNLRRLGFPEQAIASHARALSFAPGDERIHFNLARTYIDLRKVKKAREHLEKALEIAPDFAAARQFLSFLTAPPAPAAEETSSHE